MRKKGRENRGKTLSYIPCNETGGSQASKEKGGPMKKDYDPKWEKVRKNPNKGS